MKHSFSKLSYRLFRLPNESPSEFMSCLGVLRPSVNVSIKITSSQERLQGSTQNWPQIFLMGSLPSVISFYMNPTTNWIVLLAFVWLTHF